MARSRRKSIAQPTLKFTRVNLWFALGGLASIVLGFVLLAQGSITLAPLLLVLGFVALLPLAIIA
ncbi:MAG: hypothetical protein OXF01_18150 [Gemmatimonadetes bacterium]|nr:hypothetical protein [Gemmatimonadota bacterium]